METNSNITTSQKDLKQEKKQKVMQAIIFVGVLGITMLVCRVVLALHIIPTSSMEPLVRANSFVVGWRLPYAFGDPAPYYGDVISFVSTEKNEIMLKRVIGLPGDTITFDNGYVIRNGQRLVELYLPKQGVTFPLNERSEFTVPEDCIFVLGDNRTNSLDSRAFHNPYISISAIYSKVMLSFAI